MGAPVQFNVNPETSAVITNGVPCRRRRRRHCYAAAC
jgi:hypothetical protein